MANSRDDSGDDIAQPWSGQEDDWDPPDNPWDKSARNREWGTQGGWPSLSSAEPPSGQERSDGRAVPKEKPAWSGSSVDSPLSVPPEQKDTQESSVPSPSAEVSTTSPPPTLKSSEQRRGLLWVAGLTLVCLGLFAAWPTSKNKIETSPAGQPAEAAPSSLENGRSLLAAGQKSLEAGQAESAASQFRKALEELKLGDAPIEEVWQGRRWLAKATLGFHQYEEAHALWTELAARPEFSREAETALRSAASELRKKANIGLDSAGKHLAEGDFRTAESLAQESLAIYRRYGGDRTQLGRAYGAIGNALAKQGRVASARAHLRQAEQNWPENASYRTALAALGGARTEEPPAVEVSKPVSKARSSGAITSQKSYPKAKPGLADGARPEKARVRVTEVSSDDSEDEADTKDSDSRNARTERRRAGRSGSGDLTDTYRNGPVGGGSAY